MSWPIWSRPAAVQDLVENAAYLADKSPSLASRFLDAAEESFSLLSESPALGGSYETKNPRLKGVRVWQVKGFKSFLIFYRASGNRLEIIRVLHGSRDISAILADE